MFWPSRFGGNLRDGVGENGFGVLGVGEEHFEHGGGVNGLFVRFPAIVVSDHAEGGKCDFGFAGELCFGDIGHADEVEATAAILKRLGAGGKSGAVHVYVGALLVNRNTGGSGAVDEDLAKVFAVRIGG